MQWPSDCPETLTDRHREGRDRRVAAEQIVVSERVEDEHVASGENEKHLDDVVL